MAGNTINVAVKFCHSSARQAEVAIPFFDSKARIISAFTHCACIGHRWTVVDRSWWWWRCDFATERVILAFWCRCRVERQQRIVSSCDIYARIRALSINVDSRWNINLNDIAALWKHGQNKRNDVRSKCAPPIFSALHRISHYDCAELLSVCQCSPFSLASSAPPFSPSSMHFISWRLICYLVGAHGQRWLLLDSLTIFAYNLWQLARVFCRLFFLTADTLQRAMGVVEQSECISFEAKRSILVGSSPFVTNNVSWVHIACYQLHSDAASFPFVVFIITIFLLYWILQFFSSLFRSVGRCEALFLGSIVVRFARNKCAFFHFTLTVCALSRRHVEDSRKYDFLVAAAAAAAAAKWQRVVSLILMWHST